MIVFTDKISLSDVEKVLYEKEEIVVCPALWGGGKSLLQIFKSVFGGKSYLWHQHGFWPDGPMAC